MSGGNVSDTNNLESKLEIGDVVILRGGSQKMTVENFISASRVQCVWFEVTSWFLNEEGNPRPVYGALRRDGFPVDALEKA